MKRYILFRLKKDIKLHDMLEVEDAVSSQCNHMRLLNHKTLCVFKNTYNRPEQ